MGNDVVKVCKVCGRGTKKYERVACKYCGASSDNWVVTNRKHQERHRKKMLKTNDTVTITLSRDQDGRLGLQFDENLFVIEVSPHASRFGMKKGQQVVACMGKKIKSKKELLKVHNEHLLRGDPDAFILTVRNVVSKKDVHAIVLWRSPEGVFGFKTDADLFVTDVNDWCGQFGLQIGHRIVRCEDMPVKNKSDLRTARRRSPRHLTNPAVLRLAVTDNFDEWVSRQACETMDSSIPRTPISSTAPSVAAHVGENAPFAEGDEDEEFPAMAIPGTEHLDTAAPRRDAGVPAETARMQRIRRASGLSRSNRDMLMGLAQMVDGSDVKGTAAPVRRSSGAFHHAVPSSSLPIAHSNTTAPVARVLSVTAIETADDRNSELSWAEAAVPES